MNCDSFCLPVCHFARNALTGAARHLELIVEANQRRNLTRIVNPREAAIKHVVDSVLPWRIFQDAEHVADAGSGAGFPRDSAGAGAAPGTRFTLLEATQKKARFLESVVRELKLGSRWRCGQKAHEEWLKTHRVAMVTARAVAPLESRGGAVRTWDCEAAPGSFSIRVRMLKTEIAEAAAETAKRQLRLRIIERYELPDAMGTRTIVEMKRAG